MPQKIFDNDLVAICKSKVTLTLKDTYREKAPSNKTSALSKTMNMDIWVISTSNQLSIRGS